MLEHSSFFGSKMLEIDDRISILNDNLVYYQLPSGEQLNLNSEISLPQVVYNTVTDKLNNQKLILDDSQSEEQRNGKAQWILDINLNNILINYILLL
jgi:uncharacterized lipoprotein YmbA